MFQIITLKQKETTIQKRFLKKTKQNLNNLDHWRKHAFLKPYSKNVFKSSCALQ